ncbi:MAG: P1 family peptidase [Firmicutes bacterium]|nr:P1 family peptidase [Bacillota bacterium]
MSEKAKVININDIEGFRIGQAENTEAGTGCTVIIAENEMAAGLDVRGGGPASRESELLKPLASAKTINAVLLSGGSAFGLGAADGVMKYLEERGIGYDVGVTKVPLVCQSDLFDLTVGDAFVRPDSKMAYQACINSERKNYKDGNYGAGCGATVGKILGVSRCMKSGIGSFAIRIGELQIGAITAVNVFGDVYDAETGKKIAGLLDKDRKSLISTEDIMCENYKPVENKFVGNTAISAVLTNGKFDKTQLCKIASMAQAGYARSIAPVNTSADGDSIYALASGKTAADVDLVGTLAAKVISYSITAGVKSAKAAYGFIAYEDICDRG